MSPTLPRWTLAAVAALHAAVFAWGAAALPWAAFSLVAVVLGYLAAVHLATAVLAAWAARPRWLAVVWRVQAVSSLAAIAYLGWGILQSAWYLRSIYRGLGSGVAAALMAVFGLVVLVTVPLSAWGIGATGGIRGRGGKATLAAVALAIAIGGLQLTRVADRGRGTALVSEADQRAVGEALAAIDVGTLPRVQGVAPALGRAHAATCPEPIDASRLTALMTYGARAGKRKHGAHVCLQAADPSALVATVESTLRKDGIAGPVKLDLITERASLTGGLGLIDGLSVRPGLDGACTDGRCLAPWQLVVLDAFTKHAPIPAVPDARIGAAVAMIAKRLGGTPDRIATAGWLLRPGEAPLALGRKPHPPVEVTADAVAAAERAARIYIVRSQERNGRFRYLIDPFTGRVLGHNFSIPRQAGTTLILCDRAHDDRAGKRAAERSLAHLATTETPFALADGSEGGALNTVPDTTRPWMLGSTALSLAAFLECRGPLGPRWDPLIGRLARTLMAQQRPDGGFHHRLDAAAGRPVPGQGAIYVDGQIVLALTMLEAIAPDEEGTLPAKGRVHEAVERAMTYFGGDYWDGFLRPLLFIEENWHCIAAAEAVAVHRHDAYERFCLDYVAFKSRIVHDEGDGVHPDFVGGYGFGNLVPPHNTATAGFGEALAAALQIRAARGEPSPRDEARMRRVMAFLLENQWRRGTCFACAPHTTIAGGFSEHMASPAIRIDYVQHAWAALSHGAESLGLEG